GSPCPPRCWPSSTTWLWLSTEPCGAPASRYRTRAPSWVLATAMSPRSSIGPRWIKPLVTSGWKRACSPRASSRRPAPSTRTWNLPHSSSPAVPPRLRRRPANRPREFNRPQGESMQQWWRDAVLYQIYPRSFADSNGDGIGDIPGITNRLDHIAALGVDGVWLSPFYPSPWADGGYDVADFREVDPVLGTLDDFDAMVRKAHKRRLKVMIDIVPNHTSEAHPWFQEALAAGPGSPARERYVFRDGRGENGEEPPTNWRSTFGGPAWSRTSDGQWYLHMFAPEQPDLNWDDDRVREEFRGILRFWADRGVDGFRIDVAYALIKDMKEPLRDLVPVEGGRFEDILANPDHPLLDRPGVHEVYRDWRRVLSEYDPPRATVAEVWLPSDRRVRYTRPDELDQAFNFEFLEARWDAD